MIPLAGCPWAWFSGVPVNPENVGRPAHFFAVAWEDATHASLQGFIREAFLRSLRPVGSTSTPQATAQNHKEKSRKTKGSPLRLFSLELLSMPEAGLESWQIWETRDPKKAISGIVNWEYRSVGDGLGSFPQCFQETDVAQLSSNTKPEKLPSMSTQPVKTSMAPGEAGQLPATGHQDHGSLPPADAGRHRSSAAGG